MSLSEIKKELYKKDTDEEILQHDESEFDPARSEIDLKKRQAEVEDLWEEKKTSLDAGSKKTIKIGVLVVLVLLVILGAAVGFYKIRQSFFSEKRVGMVITGPADVKSGNLVTYEIKYRNENRAELKNVKLKLSYPESFRPEQNANFTTDGTTVGSFDLGTILGNAEGTVVFNGRAYSPKGNLIKIKADWSYTPSTLSSEFSVSSQAVVNIISSPITLSVLAPQNISSGDEINYVVEYRNDGAADLTGLRLKMEYPERFVFSSSEPAAAEGNNIWYVGTLAPGQTGKVVARGKLEGSRDEVGLLNVAIGTKESGEFISYNEEKVQTKITASPFSIAQTVNGETELNLNAGDNLMFEIKYKNEGTIGLRDVIVTEKLDSPVLDYASLNLREGGAYDASSKTITWKAADHKELKNLNPGEGGTIRFSVRVKAIIPVGSVSEKNFVVSSLAKIDSPDVPTPLSVNKAIAGNKMDMKLNSKLILDVQGFYNDTNIPNTGPLPPKVGQDSTYTMHLLATNISNEVTNARVEVILPTVVMATGKTFPEGAPINYNERTNTLVWELGTMIAGAGITSAQKEVAFQVRIKPASNQVGREAQLINSATFSAKDAFTGEDLSLKLGEKTTRLPEDDSTNSKYSVTN